MDVGRGWGREYLRVKIVKIFSFAVRKRSNKKIIIISWIFISVVGPVSFFFRDSQESSRRFLLIKFSGIDYGLIIFY